MGTGPRFLEYRFQRRLQWKEVEDGRVVVLRPRFGEGKAGRWLESILGLSPYRIRLDEIGTVVWKNCDGKIPARKIAEKLRNEFGDKVEPAEDRLQDFVTQMSRARMIEVSVDQVE
jgi:hypothetical protein